MACLKGDTEYSNVSVRCRNAAGLSDDSNIIESIIMLPVTQPSPPPLITLMEATSDSVTFLWSPPHDDGGAEVESYEIRYSSLEEAIEGKGVGQAAKSHMKRYRVSCGLATKYTIKGLRGAQELLDVLVVAVNSKCLVSKSSNIIPSVFTSGFPGKYFISNIQNIFLSINS